MAMSIAHHHRRADHHMREAHKHLQAAHDAATRTESPRTRHRDEVAGGRKANMTLRRERKTGKRI